MVAENNDRLSNGCINPHAFDWMAPNAEMSLAFDLTTEE